MGEVDDPDGDSAIMDLVARGLVRDALARLMRRHGDAIYTYCVRALHEDRTRAADARQTVFVQAFRDLPGFRGRSSLRSWLLKIARNRCIDAARSTAVHAGPRHVSLEQLDVAASAQLAPDEALDRARAHAAAIACLDKLSPPVRETVLLFFSHGVRYDELAELVDAQAKTLEARIRRALPMLRRCLVSKGIAR